jgi:hypothetical protein
MAIEEIAERLNSLDLDALRQSALADIRSGKKTKRAKGVKLLRAVDGLQRANVKPEDLLISRVPVIPAAFRPYTTAGDTFIPGDANELYSDLVKAVKMHEEHTQVFGSSSSSPTSKYVREAARATYGYADSPNPKIKSRNVSGFLQKIIGGNPKTSWVQQKLLAKPQDFVGRGVISPDPDLGMDELGLPESMAWDLFDAHIRRSLSARGVPVSRALELIKEKHPLAKQVLEQEMREKPVIYSRAPAWHKHNVISGYAKIADGDNIMISPYVTAGVAGDFDGDSLDLETPIILRNQGTILFMTGRDIEKLMSHHTENEIICANGFEAWTYSGWSKVVNFSLHTVKTKRKYRIELNNGIGFVVSEDHSLMVDRKETKPEELSIGVSLDYAVPEVLASECSQFSGGYQIKSITEVPYNDRMIDLEVESGEHVFTIVGGVVLHNTMAVHVPALPEAVKDAQEKLLPSKMLFSVRSRDTTLPQPKHEMTLGLASAQLNPSGTVHQVRSAEEALEGIRSGAIKLQDQVEIASL